MRKIFVQIEQVKVGRQIHTQAVFRDEDYSITSLACSCGTNTRDIPNFRRVEYEML